MTLVVRLRDPLYITVTSTKLCVDFRGVEGVVFTGGELRVARGKAQRQAFLHLHLVNKYSRSASYVLDAGNTMISKTQTPRHGAQHQ